MKDISLVIQGPILSRDYDCSQSICRIAKDYADKVDCIVLSTWENNHFAAPALLCDFVTLRNRLPDGPDRRNRRHQWVSSHEGVKFIRDNIRSKFILKMRTDQWVHPKILDFMMQFYENHSFAADAFQKHYLLFCYCHRNVPFHIGDFFFGGVASDVENLLHSALSYGSQILQDAAELDLILKYLKRNDAQFPIPFWNLCSQMATFEKYAKESVVWQYWLTQYRQRFACFPREIFSSLEWRGARTYFDPYWNYRGNQIWKTYIDYYEEWQMVRSNRDLYFSLPIETTQRVRWLKDWVLFLWLLIQSVIRFVRRCRIRISSLLRRGTEVFAFTCMGWIKKHQKIRRLALAVYYRLPF